MMLTSAVIRGFGTGAKYLSIISLPLIFENTVLSLVGIFLALERFLSFVISLECYSYFNRKIINYNRKIKYINSQHLPFIIYGLILASFFMLSYSIVMNFPGNIFICMAIFIIGSIMNEIARKAQALSFVISYSIISALKSLILPLSLVLVWSHDQSFAIFLQIYFLSSLAILAMTVILFAKLFIVDLKIFKKHISQIHTITFGVVKLNKFVLMGVVTFSIFLIERTLILYRFDEITLNEYFLIQSLALSSCIVVDLFFWGPSYPKIINGLKGSYEESYIDKNYILKQLVIWILVASLCYCVALTCLYVMSEVWASLFLAKPFWLIANFFIIILFPIDTLLTYWLHANHRDLMNAAASIISLLIAVLVLLKASVESLVFFLVAFYFLNIVLKLITVKRFE